MRDKIRGFILEIPQVKKGLATGELNELSDDTNLMEKGIIESLNAINLVLFLEKEFGIEVKSADLTSGNFQSVNHIIAYLQKKKAQI